LNILFEDRTLLIGVHGIERFPYTDDKAAVWIVDILGEPPAPKAGDLFACHGRPIGLLILLPTACPLFPPGNAHNHLWFSYDSVTLDTREVAWDTLDLLVPPARVPLDDGPRGPTSRIEEILLSLTPWSLTCR